MLTRYMAGLAVRSWSSLSTSISLKPHLKCSTAKRRSLPLLSHSSAVMSVSMASFAFLLFGSLRTSFSKLGMLFSTDSMSFMRSSARMMSRSRMGSHCPSVCVTPVSFSSKTRTMWKIASVARMCERKALPRPSPSCAFFTSPAMSTTVSQAGTLLAGWYFSQSTSKRSSGTRTRDVVGSMVQNGKFSAGTLMPHSTLKVVDLPTLGRPTRPAETLLPGRPSIGLGSSPSFFLGAMASGSLGG
mmetsp:Transcript_27168/g.90917  ORF Transcript_27168/g.90917 Transcript_27168/m.90917 type:complete len:243 (+) Transcript_27168:889-1617(+)